MLPGAFKTCESLATSDTSECTQLLHPRQSFQNSKHASLLRNFDRGENIYIIYKKNIIQFFFCLSTLYMWNILIKYVKEKSICIRGIGRGYMYTAIIFIRIRLIWLCGYFWANWLELSRRLCVQRIYERKYNSRLKIYSAAHRSGTSSSWKISMPRRSPTSNRAVSKDNAQYRNSIPFPMKTLCGWN